ncbi:Fibrinogen-like protein 1 [Holothuria leucospilota]|uniref:Fibrinogen-like protein 1 n=1 Tax=Holothuria leucospilota TaxID=206669 RepID=A0A9Q1GXW2_HOLLE|nr:Fibrinogen-like protein 1 [Holothuria leucospilota]
MYYIKPEAWLKAPFKVYCDMTEGGGWTVIQRRTGQDLYKFRRSWMSYKKGFHNSLSSFWLGNDKLHFLTKQDNYDLLIDIKQNENGVMQQQTCHNFRIKSEKEMYELEGVEGMYQAFEIQCCMKYILLFIFSKGENKVEMMKKIHTNFIFR